MSSDTVVYTYDETRNPHGGYLPGVPLRDLTQADLDSLPGWILPSVAAAPYYVPAVPLGAPSDSPQPKRKKSED